MPESRTRHIVRSQKVQRRVPQPEHTAIVFAGPGYEPDVGVRRILTDMYSTESIRKRLVSQAESKMASPQVGIDHLHHHGANSARREGPH